MPELKFSGSAVLTGFPAEKAFAFELEANRLIIRAGKEVFATIEKAQLTTAEKAPNGVYSGYDVVIVPEPVGGVLQPAEYKLVDEPTASVDTPHENATAAAVKGKSYSGNLSSLILIDTTRKAAYRTIRAKYFETLKTANGREVGWWMNTSMVKSLEGEPLKMLQFFIEDGTVRIDQREDGARPVDTVNHIGQAQGWQPQASLQSPGEGTLVSAAQAQWTPPLPSGAAAGFPAPTPPIAGQQQAGPSWVPPANFGKFA